MYSRQPKMAGKKPTERLSALKRKPMLIYNIGQAQDKGKKS